MLIPVLNIEDTAIEIINFQTLLIKLKYYCAELNMQWKIARLLSDVTELKDVFINEYAMWHIEHEQVKINTNFFENENINHLFSSAFQSVSILDAARYIEFESSAQFKERVKLMSKEILLLLHQNKGWATDEYK